MAIYTPEELARMQELEREMWSPALIAALRDQLAPLAQASLRTGKFVALPTGGAVGQLRAIHSALCTIGVEAVRREERGTIYRGSSGNIKGYTPDVG